MVDAMKEKEKILEMKHITKRFGGLTALDDVHFDLYTNEILALVGDNGAGKSTLIKIIPAPSFPMRVKYFCTGTK